MSGRQARHEQAIVLGKTKLSEQDVILTLLAAPGDRVRAVAKGARKPGGRLAARTELFCESELLIASGRGSLHVVSEASVIDAHAGIRGNLDRVAAASVIAEVARLTCYEDMADPFLYPICARSLTACERSATNAHLGLVISAYVLKVLAHSGWRPELGGCIACGDPDVGYISARAGGVVCSSCVRDVPDAETVSPDALGWLAYLIGTTFDELAHVAVDERTASWLVGFAHRWAATHLDARLRAFEFFRGVAPV